MSNNYTRSSFAVTANAEEMQWLREASDLLDSMQTDDYEGDDAEGAIHFVGTAQWVQEKSKELGLTS